MADKYELLENAIAAQIAAQVPTFITVAPVAASGILSDGARPRAEVIWSGCDTKEVGSIGSRIRVLDDITITVYIFAADAGGVMGGARLGTGGGYDLRGQVRKALLGFEPAISNTECVFPMQPIVGRSEFPMQTETGLYGLAMLWTVTLQSYEGQG